MSITYVESCAYSIIACPKGECADVYMPLTKREIANLRKTHPGKLEKALEKLSSDHMCGGSTMKPAAYKDHLSKCFIPGAKAAKIKYRLSGYARISITFDHELSDEEHTQLDDAIEGQMIDGYGENPFELFTIDGFTYWLTI